MSDSYPELIRAEPLITEILKVEEEKFSILLNRGMEILNDNLNKDFECIKCENKEFVEGKINTTGSGLSKFFNIQLHTFQTISCSECGYTDLFRREKSSFLSRLLQFFTN